VNQFQQQIHHGTDSTETQKTQSSKNKTESNRKEETRTEILIFEDLHAPSSKLELWLPHDESQFGRTLPNSRSRS